MKIITQTIMKLNTVVAGKKYLDNIDANILNNASTSRNIDLISIIIGILHKLLKTIKKILTNTIKEKNTQEITLTLNHMRDGTNHLMMHMMTGKKNMKSLNKI